MPPYTITTRVLSVMIDAIQVAGVTTVVPPGSLILHRTVRGGPGIVILIFCCEWITIMISQGVSTGS